MFFVLSSWLKSVIIKDMHDRNELTLIFLYGLQEVFFMAISNDELFRLVNELPEESKQSAYDFLKFLIVRNTRPDWDEIEYRQSW